MNTIHAIYEAGVFRPIDEVDLPEHAEVEFERRPMSAQRKAKNAEDLRKHFGTIKLSEDPLEYQLRIREE